MMFAFFEVMGGTIVLWIYVTAKVGDFWKGLLASLVISMFLELLLVLTVTRLRALYVLLAFGISAGWAWIGYTLAPQIFDDPHAPLYGAGLLGIGSLLEKFLMPQAYMTNHGEVAGKMISDIARIPLDK